MPVIECPGPPICENCGTWLTHEAVSLFGDRICWVCGHEQSTPAKYLDSHEPTPDSTPYIPPNIILGEE